MKVLSRYLIKDFMKLQLLCTGIFVFIYLIIDFFQKIDNLIEADAQLYVMYLFFLNKIPLIIVQMLPPATLITIIVMFSSMKKRNEITAMKACGLNILRAFLPIFVASFIIGAALFVFSEMIVPFTSAKSNEIWNVEVEKRDTRLFYGSRQIWYKGHDSIYWVRDFDHEKGVMIKPTFYFFDKAFNLIKRIDGRKGSWEKNGWKIEDGILQEAMGEGGFQFKKFETLHLDIPETPETFVRGERSPEEMSYWQLKRYAEKVQMEGYDNTEYLVDMNIKLAFPFIIVVMTLIGFSLSQVHKGESIPVVVSLGLGISFVYMILLGFARSLGLAGILPPLLATWLANLVFFLLGIYLMMHVER